jgi:hypothetical protein
MKQLETLALVVAFGLGSTALVRTQEKPATPPAAKAQTAPVAAPALKVQVVIGRYQGEKKISSMPYTLTLNAGGRANLRMGTKIPISMMAMSNASKDAPAGGPINYQDVGTNIDCSATEVDGGRFSLVISVDDSSVYPDDASGSARSSPSFRSFRATNSMLLKNGETGQFTSATDKVTGETVRVDVTLTVMR